MAKNLKQAPETEAEKPKSKKLLVIIVVIVLVIAGGAAGWYFTMGGHSAAEQKAEAKTTYLDQPKFIALEPFTVNLQREDNDQYLQVGMSLKIYNPALEDQIKANMPEIRSKLLLLLSSKRASELVTVAGKKKLADEIISATDGVLGIKRPASAKPAAVAAASGVAAASEASAASDEETTAPEQNAKDGIVDVLFTSFIIQ